MCGRYTLRTPAAEVAEQFQLFPPPDWEPRYNLAPTQQVLAIRQQGAERAWARLRWGLVPGWADDLSIGARMINARSETAATKPSFRTPFKQRRCLVVADGFYEWKKEGKLKQPYFITLADELPFAFAGLWERWGRGGDTVETCTILTTEANALMRPLHERMPVILPAESYSVWLDPDLQQSEPLQPLLSPYPADEMAARPVDRWVNSPTHEGPQCLAEPS